MELCQQRVGYVHTCIEDIWVMIVLYIFSCTLTSFYGYWLDVHILVSPVMHTLTVMSCCRGNAWGITRPIQSWSGRRRRGIFPYCLFHWINYYRAIYGVQTPLSPCLLTSCVIVAGEANMSIIRVEGVGHIFAVELNIVGRDLCTHQGKFECGC